MFRPRVIPVLSLMGGGLVKTFRFNKKKARYIGDPINAVRLFNDMEADELIILDITASIENRTFSAELVKRFGDEAFMPFSVGGGIRTIKDIKAILASGAEKVIINSAACLNPQLITEASTTFGNQSIIVSMDLKRNLLGKHLVFALDGTRVIKTDPVEYAQRIESMGAGEIMINYMDRDGSMMGYDTDYTRIISDAVGLPVILCGGAGNLSHLVVGIRSGGASAVAAGSMFVYHGNRNAVLINYPDRNELSHLFQ
jgi:imidazole glycerol-phosphate synthase subunit HisF